MTQRQDRTPRRRLDPLARQEAILAAASELFAAHGYADVSVAQIAEAAAASPALVFRYYASKSALYVAVTRQVIEDFDRRRAAAVQALPAGASTRDRVSRTIHVYLDQVAAHPTAWATHLTRGQEPAEAIDLRRQARQDYADALQDLLRPTFWPRHHYALLGFLGFLDQACLAWLDAGAPAEHRHPLVDAALGALEGSLGDWGS